MVYLDYKPVINKNPPLIKESRMGKNCYEKEKITPLIKTVL